MLGLVGYVEPIRLSDPSCKWIGPETSDGCCTILWIKEVQLDLGKEEKIIKERDMWEGFCPVSFLFTCPATCRPTTETWNKKRDEFVVVDFLSSLSYSL